MGKLRLGPTSGHFSRTELHLGSHCWARSERPLTRSLEALVRTSTYSILALTCSVIVAVGCGGSSGDSSNNPGVGGSESGGTSAHASTVPATGGIGQSGGASSSVATATGGKLSTGGTTNSVVATGGARPTGGTSATSPAGTGGARPTGGAPATGGTNNATGGALPTGGASAAGTGGASATGGKTGTGGTSTLGGASSTGGSATAGTSTAGGSNGNAKPSAGCGKAPTLKNSTSTANQNTLTVSGASRQYLVRWPTNYDNTHPYRLILGFHGAGGSDTDIGPSYFGLFSLSNNSTIFVAPSATSGTWNATNDLTFVDEILKAVEADLCIDTSRVELEGFSQGGAMVAVLACQRPGVFRAAVGHSRGGLTAPTTCQPIPYLGSLGLGDIAGNSQATQTDPFAKWNGCTVTTMPLAPTGSHVCTKYTNCPAADPVTFCSFDGPHTASPTDAGKTSSWMPQEVWTFLSAY